MVPSITFFNSFRRFSSAMTSFDRLGARLRFPSTIWPNFDTVFVESTTYQAHLCVTCTCMNHRLGDITFTFFSFLSCFQLVFASLSRRRIAEYNCSLLILSTMIFSRGSSFICYYRWDSSVVHLGLRHLTPTRFVQEQLSQRRNLCYDVTNIICIELFENTRVTIGQALFSTKWIHSYAIESMSNYLKVNNFG